MKESRSISDGMHDEKRFSSASVNVLMFAVAEEDKKL